MAIQERALSFAAAAHAGAHDKAGEPYILYESATRAGMPESVPAFLGCGRRGMRKAASAWGIFPFLKNEKRRSQEGQSPVPRRLSSQ